MAGMPTNVGAGVPGRVTEAPHNDFSELRGRAAPRRLEALCERDDGGEGQGPTRSSAVTSGQDAGDLHRVTAFTAGCEVCRAARSAMRSAMNSASSSTQPSSADPRVCCQGRPEEVQPGRRRDAALVRPPVRRRRGRGHVDERVVEAEAGGPDHGGRRQRWRRRRSAPCGRRRRRRGRQPDAPASRRPRARADERLPVLQAAAEPRGHRRPHQPSGVEVVEEVAAEEPLRQRGLARADRQVHLPAGVGELLGDLVAGVAAADDQRGPLGDLLRAAGTSVLCSCIDARVQPLGERRHGTAPGTGRWRSRPAGRATSGRRGRRWNPPSARRARRAPGAQLDGQVEVARRSR